MNSQVTIISVVRCKSMFFTVECFGSFRNAARILMVAIKGNHCAILRQPNAVAGEDRTYLPSVPPEDDPHQGPAGQRRPADLASLEAQAVFSKLGTSARSAVVMRPSPVALLRTLRCSLPREKTGSVASITRSSGARLLASFSRPSSWKLSNGGIGCIHISVGRVERDDRAMHFVYCSNCVTALHHQTTTGSQLLSIWVLRPSPIENLSCASSCGGRACALLERLVSWRPRMERTRAP